MFAGEIQRQVIIRLKNEKNLTEFKKKIPPHFEIIDSAGTIVILRSKNPTVSSGEIKSLQKLPVVRSATLDAVVKERESPHTCADCNPSAGRPDSIDISSLVPALCPLQQVCPDGLSQDQFWGQRRVDGDLMIKAVQNIENQLRSQGKSSPTTKICVIDTGFDLKNMRSEISSPEFEVKSCARSFPFFNSHSIGNPESDERGHGTAVSGLIGGKQGIGLAPNLQMVAYRMSPPGSEEAALPLSVTQICIERALRDECDIINYSHGTDQEEHGENQGTSGIETNPEIREQLANNGSLMVTAAGNNSFRVPNRNQNPEDGILRVAASNGTGEISFFSTDGEIQAPGESIYTLNTPTSHTAGTRCTDKNPPGTLIHGTSFAAPIVSAIAGQVLWVLKTKPYFMRMRPELRIALLNRILKASELRGSINGLRAISLANRLNSNLPLPSIEQLKDSMSHPPDESCSHPVKKCSVDNNISCSDQQKCVDENRMQISLCEPPSDEAIDSLTHYYLQSPSFSETAEYFMSMHTPQTDPRKASSLALQTWNSLEKSPGIAQLSSYERIFPALIHGAARTPEGSEKVRSYISTLVNHYRLNTRILDLPLGTSDEVRRRDEEDVTRRGANEALDHLASTLYTVVQERGPSELTSALSSVWIQNPYSWLKPNSGKIPVAPARIINSLIEDPRFVTLRPQLLQIEKQMYALYEAKRGTPNFQNSSYLNPMIARQRPQTSPSPSK